MLKLKTQFVLKFPERPDWISEKVFETCLKRSSKAFRKLLPVLRASLETKFWVLLEMKIEASSESVSELCVVLLEKSWELCPKSSSHIFWSSSETSLQSRRY